MIYICAYFKSKTLQELLIIILNYFFSNEKIAFLQMKHARYVCCTLFRLYFSDNILCLIKLFFFLL